MALILTGPVERQMVHDSINRTVQQISNKMEKSGAHPWSETLSIADRQAWRSRTAATTLCLSLSLSPFFEFTEGGKNQLQWMLLWLPLHLRSRRWTLKRRRSLAIKERPKYHRKLRRNGQRHSWFVTFLKLFLMTPSLVSSPTTALLLCVLALMGGIF